MTTLDVSLSSCQSPKTGLLIRKCASESHATIADSSLAADLNGAFTTHKWPRQKWQKKQFCGRRPSRQLHVVVLSAENSRLSSTSKKTTQFKLYHVPTENISPSSSYLSTISLLIVNANSLTTPLLCGGVYSSKHTPTSVLLLCRLFEKYTVQYWVYNAH